VGAAGLGVGVPVARNTGEVVPLSPPPPNDALGCLEGEGDTDEVMKGVVVPLPNAPL